MNLDFQSANQISEWVCLSRTQSEAMLESLSERMSVVYALHEVSHPCSVIIIQKRPREIISRSGI